eukprot:4452720-Ditylum_brightwellii.AAC.1
MTLSDTTAVNRRYVFDQRLNCTWLATKKGYDWPPQGNLQKHHWIMQKEASNTTFDLERIAVYAVHNFHTMFVSENLKIWTYRSTF